MIICCLLRSLLKIIFLVPNMCIFLQFILAFMYEEWTLWSSTWGLTPLSWHPQAPCFAPVPEAYSCMLTFETHSQYEVAHSLPRTPSSLYLRKADNQPTCLESQKSWVGRSEFEASVGYMSRPFLRKSNDKAKQNKHGRCWQVEEGKSLQGHSAPQGWTLAWCALWI